MDNHLLNHDDDNRSMLLDVDDARNETQENDTNQDRLSIDTPILRTTGGKRLLSTSTSSNDEENPNQDSDDNGIQENHAIHDENDDRCTHSSETEVEQNVPENQNRENHISRRRPLPTAANRQLQNAEQRTTNDESEEACDNSQSSSDTEDNIPQNTSHQESQRVVDMRKKREERERKEQERIARAIKAVIDKKVARGAKAATCVSSDDDNLRWIKHLADDVYVMKHNHDQTQEFPYRQSELTDHYETWLLESA